MKAITLRLQVLARSSPEDKQILVEMLKEGGDIVGVTGDRTIDGIPIWVHLTTTSP